MAAGQVKRFSEEALNSLAKNQIDRAKMSDWIIPTIKAKLLSLMAAIGHIKIGYPAGQ